MSKSAEKRRKHRLEYLAKLASTNPERFREEWSRRVDSWLQEIWRRAGRLGNSVPSVFELVDEARRILAECGIKENSLESYCSVDALANECCKALTLHIGDRGHRLNVNYKRRD